MRIIKTIITIGLFLFISLQQLLDISTYAQFNGLSNGGRGAGAIGFGGLGANLGGGRFAGGPSSTGTKICMKGGLIMSGVSVSGGINFFCCEQDSECQSYNVLYNDGLGTATCTSDQSRSYCPVLSGINFENPVLSIEKFFILSGSRYTGAITNGMSGMYQIIITNFGSGEATGVITKDYLPPLFNYSTYNTTTGIVSYLTGTHEIDRTNFTVNPKSTVTLDIYGTRTVNSSGVVTNFANIANPDYCSMTGSSCMTQYSHILQPPLSGVCNSVVMTGYYSGINTLPNGSSLCINGNLSGLIQLQTGRSWNCDGLFGGIHQNNCNLQIHYCGDSIKNGTETCDDGNNNANDGCYQCAFETPTCTLGLFPNVGIAPLGVTSSWTIPTWISTVFLDRGDSTIVNNPNNPQANNYISNGQYIAQLVVKNNLTGSTLTGLCTGIISVSLSPINGVCGINNNLTFYSLLSGGSSLFSGSAGLCNPGIVSGFSYSNGARNRYCAGVNSGNTAVCSATESYCGDGVIGNGVGYSNTEKCDDNNNIPGDGCGPLCGFETPNCSLIASPSSGNAPLNINITWGSLSGRVSTQTLNFGNGNAQIISPTGTQNSSYLTAGNYTAILIIKNNLTGSTVTNQCSITISATLEPITGSCSSSIFSGYSSGDILPSTGSLCSSGILSNLNQTVSGWSWSCLGTGGGASSFGCNFTINLSGNSSGSFCGGLNQISCISGSACSTGLVNQSGICLSGCDTGFNNSGGSCVSCGGTGEVICNSGLSCLTGLVSSGGFCVSISTGTNSTGTNNTGSLCGGLNQISCISGSACSTGLVNQSGICLSGCDTGFNNSGGSCVSCGGTGEVICNSGLSCLTGLVSSGGFCVSISTGTNSTGTNNTGTTIVGQVSLSNGSEYQFQNLPKSSSLEEYAEQVFGTSTFTQTVVSVATEFIKRMIPIPDRLDLGELYIYNNSNYPPEQNIHHITTNIVIKKKENNFNQQKNVNKSKKSSISYLPKFASLIAQFIPSYKPFIADPRFSNEQTTLDLNAYDKNKTLQKQSVNTRNDGKLIIDQIKIIPIENNDNNELSQKVNEQDSINIQTEPQSNTNTLENYTIDTTALKALFLCQEKSNISQQSLDTCIKNLPNGNCSIFNKKINENPSLNKENITNCIPEAKSYIKPDYEAVQGALYINRNTEIEQEITFLQQFIPSLIIHNTNIFGPFINENIARIEFDPDKISNKQMEILLVHLSDSDYLGSILKKLAIEIPLFKTAAEPSYNDPLKNKQSYLQAIKFSEAENICNRESPKKISVAIVDSAFETDHEDLGTNIKGTFDIANKDEDVNPPFGKENDTEWSHGTYSAGIIGAVNNNQKGIISIAGDISNIYIYKAAKDNGIGSDIAYGAESLIYAAKNKPQIISLSRGAYINDKKALSFLEKLVNKITDQGSIIVASAGNYNKSEKFYPAAFEKVVSVGAIDNNFNKASFSNYGDRVDIAAPGKDIMTTSLGNLYESIDGTSESAPLVAGALAWIMSKGGTLDDLESSMSPIRSAVGKGAINLEKTCAKIAAQYNSQNNNQHYAPDDKDLKKDFETQFKNQSNQSNQSTGKMIFGLLLLILIIILGALIHKIREKHII